jgi:TolA-binding protein
MRSRLFALALVAALAAAGASPAFAADKETRQMMADIRMLQERQQQIQTTIAQLVEQLKAVEKSLDAKIDDQTEATRKGLADEKTVTTSIQTDLRSVRERLDSNTTQLGTIDGEITALRQLITSRPSFTAPDSSAQPPATTPDSSAAAPDTGSPMPGASPKALWDSAFADYTGGDYGLAVEGFKAYINASPNGAQAPDAQVNICNAYLNDKKYQQAVDACDAAIRNYPKAPGDIIPQAYYRKGLALMDLGQTDQAREAFDYVIKTWPDSTPAALASQAEQTLRPAAPAPRR